MMAGDDERDRLMIILAVLQRTMRLFNAVSIMKIKFCGEATQFIAKLFNADWVVIKAQYCVLIQFGAQPVYL